jgi:serine/threonine-protein kinase
MPKSSLPPPPKVNGRYDIKEAPIGQGGMGIVYKAYDNVTKRFVALKTMWGDADPAAIELFEREWTVLARLSHPNIVDILDTGEFRENGQRKPYFVMPLLQGLTLDQLIKTSSQRLSVERITDIMYHACRGLQAAHDQGLIHRDLKPSNIFVMDDDTVKIIDFGVVHLADVRSVTGIKGTLQYMAPEQLEMKPATALSDIFSLAVVCYEALTGRKPFARKTESEVVDAIRTHIPPPASEINTSVNQLVSRTVHKAMAKQPWHRFSSAREFGDTLQKALRNEPIERFDRAKIQPRIERVKKAYGEGDHQFAMEILTELESEGHIDSDMSVLRVQIEKGLRQKIIRQLLESARTRMEEEEYPLALQKISDVLNIDADNVDALSLKSQIDRQRGEKQIDNWFRLVREHRDNQLYSQARQGLQEVLKIDSSNTQARQMLAEIDQTEQESIKLREEKQRLYESAVNSYKNGEISTALTKLERVLDLNQRTAKSITPDLDAQCQSFYNQVRSERDAARSAYAEGRKHLLDGNVTKALELCEEYLQKHPGDPMFQALKLEAGEFQRQQQSSAVAEVNRRAEAEPDLDKKYNIIKEAVEKYPQEPHFKSSLKSIRERRDLVNSIVGRARHYEERGQFNDASSQWDILRNIYPLYPGLAFEVERLARRKEEQVHAEVKARWMERIDGHFGAGEYGKARDVIKEALAEFPDDKELQGLGALAEQGVKRSSEADVLLKQGRELCAAKNFDAGIEALRKAERLDPRNAIARATLLGVLVQHARALMSKDWRAAEPLVKEALELNAGDPVARSLSSLIDDYRRQDAIGKILVDARNSQGAGDLSGALQQVEEGLATFPNEVRLSQLHNTLRTSLGSQAAQNAPESTHREVTPPPAAPVTPPVPEPSAVATIVQPTAPPTVVQTPPPAPPVAPPPSQPPPQKSKIPAWILAVAAAVLVLAAAGLFTVLRSHKTTTTTPTEQQTVPVQLISNVPNTTFTVDGKPVSSASLNLDARDHTAEASHAGYLSMAKTFTVSSSATAPLKVAFELLPALPELRVITPLKAGKFVLDDGEATDLQDGSLTKGGIPMGDHTVKIFDGKSQVFAFAFHAEPSAMPTLAGPLGASRAPGFVVASLAGSAKVYATPGMRGGVADQAPNPIPPAGLDIAAAGASETHLVIDDGKGKPRDLTVDSSALPVLTVILSGAADRVPVTVTANVPDGSVVVNGFIKGHLVNGSRVIQLEAGNWTVKVTHDGYQDAPEQKLQLKAGDTSPQKLNFDLAAVVSNATLSISSAPADAAVFIDDVRAGTVNGAGSFTKEISPGSHAISLRKPGFEELKITRDFKSGESAKLSGAMKSMSSLALKILPAAAHITVRRDGDSADLVIANNQSSPVHPGSYKITAEAQNFEPKTETVQVDPGKTVSLDWQLKPASGPVVAKKGADAFFENGPSWKVESGWWIHDVKGYSFLRNSPGVMVFDLLKDQHGGLFKKVRKIVFVADYRNEKNKILYTLDGHNLTRRVYTDGSAGEDKKVPHGMEANSSYRIMVELKPDAITIKNGAGKVLDTAPRSGGGGKFGFEDEVGVAPLGR